MELEEWGKASGSHGNGVGISHCRACICCNRCINCNDLLPILPYALAFAAGAMIFIVVEEVIPESQSGGNTDLATMGLIAGFIVMMTLDVGLG